MVKYYINITKKTHNSLVHEAYRLGVQLDNVGTKNWVSGVKHILKLLDMENMWKEIETTKGDNIATTLLDRLKLKFQQHSFDLLHDDNKGTNHQNKLRTYRQFKKDTSFEKYLAVIKNPYHRSAMTKLRISAHTLKIETGRHQNINVAERKCPVCSTQKIEDEEHFLLHCPCYNNIRNEYSQKTGNANIDQICLTKILESKNENTLIKLGKFIYQCFNLREENMKLTKPAAS